VKTLISTATPRGDAVVTLVAPLHQVQFALQSVHKCECSAYAKHYELKSTTLDRHTACRLFQCYLRAAFETDRKFFPTCVEDVFAVDNWLWFLAIENLFVHVGQRFPKGAGLWVLL
jgi:hypothetical protein